MSVRKTTYLALTLLVAAGSGVCEASAKAQSAWHKKHASSKSGTSSRRSKSPRRSSRKGQKAPTPERISEIQQALGKDGSFSGTPNGKWDASTVEAMKRFQEVHGLSPTGKLDAKTLQQLGLGSQTAGVAPPMPPVSSSSSKTTPTQTARRQQ